MQPRSTFRITCSLFFLLSFPLSDRNLWTNCGMAAALGAAKGFKLLKSFSYLQNCIYGL